MQDFSALLGDMKMLDELKSNEESIIAAWENIRNSDEEKVKESNVRSFMIKVYNALNSKKSSLYKKFSLTRSANIVSDETIKKKVQNDIKNEELKFVPQISENSKILDWNTKLKENSERVPRYQILINKGIKY